MAVHLLLGVSVAPFSAAAQPADTFYEGKTIRFIGPGGAGGPFEVYSRTMEPYLRKYLPGRPTIIVQAMPGGGGTVAANYLYNVAPRDGTLIGFLLQAVALNQLLELAGVNYDAGRFGFIASLEPLDQTLLVWHTAPVRSIEDARRVEVPLGSTGQASPTSLVPALTNKFLGTRFRIITGYRGADDIALALERGEVKGIALHWHSLASDKPGWTLGKVIFPVVHAGLTRNPAFPDTPTIVELAANKSDREVLELYALTTALGRVLVAPPLVPTDRLEVLRAAVAKTIADPAFIADAKARKLNVEPSDAAQAASIVARTLGASKEAVAQVKALLQSQ